MNNAEIIIHGKKEGSGSGDEKIPILYSPSEYSFEWSAEYAAKTCQSQGEKQEFVGEKSGSMSFNFTLDGYTMKNTDKESEAEDVSVYVEKLKSLTVTDAKLHKPPECSFSWGTIIFRGVSSKLNARYTLFTGEGKPIRAVVDITIVQADGKKKPLESPDRTKKRMLIQDTELFMLSYEAYDDPCQWRNIAVANGIKNPRLLETGMALLVPPLDGEL